MPETRCYTKYPTELSSFCSTTKQVPQKVGELMLLACRGRSSCVGVEGDAFGFRHTLIGSLRS